MTKGYRIKFGTNLKDTHILKAQRLNDGKPESAETKITKADCVKIMHAWATAMAEDAFLPSLAGTPSPYVAASVEEGTGALTLIVRNVVDGTDALVALTLTVADLQWRPTDVAGIPPTSAGSPTLQ